MDEKIGVRKHKGEPPDGEEGDFRVDDRRHWAQGEPGDETSESADAAPARPTLLEQYRQRAEEAERKLLQYIEAFKEHQNEQEQFRERLTRDVERRVELKFGELVADLLESADHLDLALTHADGRPVGEGLARGVAIARDSFLAALERHGIQKFAPDGEVFDPTVAEAMRVDPVRSLDEDGTVTETLQPGYRLGQHVIRPARVAVGRYLPSS